MVCSSRSANYQVRAANRGPNLSSSFLSVTGMAEDFTSVAEKDTYGYSESFLVSEIS